MGDTPKAINEKASKTSVKTGKKITDREIHFSSTLEGRRDVGPASSLHRPRRVATPPLSKYLGYSVEDDSDLFAFLLDLFPSSGQLGDTCFMCRQVIN